MARDPEAGDLLRHAVLAALPRGAQLNERPIAPLCLMRRGNMVGAVWRAGQAGPADRRNPPPCRRAAIPMTSNRNNFYRTV
ncbi:hypothetical protein B0A89_06595 [Paracoccus contaminans]|uniref:Uncharacterized protein n=1 Tax=Paracoccus contaminans TaxID=1945662 RepID=A0A1W6CWW4_9RHOB|nr:hypothetical protein B0A89_06595 [Paracoccus contaminans]